MGIWSNHIFLTTVFIQILLSFKLIFRAIINFQLFQINKLWTIYRQLFWNRRYLNDIDLSITLMSCQINRWFRFKVLFFNFDFLFEAVIVIETTLVIYGMVINRLFSTWFLWLSVEFYVILQEGNFVFQLLNLFFVISHLLGVISFEFINLCVCQIKLLLTLGISYGKILLNIFHLFDEILLINQSLLENIIFFLLSF